MAPVDDIPNNLNTAQPPPAPQLPTPAQTTTFQYNGKFLSEDLDLTFVLLELQLQDKSESDRFRAYIKYTSN